MEEFKSRSVARYMKGVQFPLIGKVYERDLIFSIKNGTTKITRVVKLPLEI